MNALWDEFLNQVEAGQIPATFEEANKMDRKIHKRFSSTFQCPGDKPGLPQPVAVPAA